MSSNAKVQNILNLSPPGTIEEKPEKKVQEKKEKTDKKSDLMSKPIVSKKQKEHNAREFAKCLNDMNEVELIAFMDMSIRGGMTKDPMSNFDRMIQYYVSEPWDNEVLQTFIKVYKSIGMTKSQKMNLVDKFRKHAPLFLQMRSILLKLKAYAQPEYTMYETKKRIRKHQKYLETQRAQAEKYKDFFTENSQIPNKYTFLCQPEIDTIVSSVTSGVQSGKTDVALRLAHKSVMSGIPVVYIILDRDAGAEQTHLRLNSYVDQFRDWCEHNAKLYIPFEYVFAQSSTKTTLNQMKRFLNPDEKNPGMIVSYGNCAQIKKVLGILDQIVGFHPYNLIMDEVDITEKKNSSKVCEYSDDLINMSEQMIGITATAFKFWYQDQMVVANLCHQLEIHPMYRGIETIQLHSAVCADTFLMNRNTKEEFMDHDVGFIPYIDSLYKEDDFEYKDVITGKPRTHPVICLYKNSDMVNHHDQVLNYIMNHRRNKWAVIIYDGKGIRLYHTDLTVWEMKFPDGSTSKPFAGVHNIRNKCLSEVLGYLRRSYENDEINPRNILIVSGKLVNRQISYVCDEYVWHLTHMRLLTPAAPDCSNLIQQMRLCGIYRHDTNQDIPLKLSIQSEVLTEIKKAYVAQTLMLKEAQQAQDGKTMSKLIFGSDAKAFPQGKIPEIRFAVGIPKKAVKTLPDHMFEEKESDESDTSDSEDEKELDAAVLELKNVLINQIKAGKDKAIVRIFKYFKENTYVSKSDIKNACRITQTSNYTLWDRKSGKYMILVSDGNNWVINEQIREMFDSVKNML